MFDDQNPTTNTGQPPANLPVKEPDDMFAGTDPAPSNPALMQDNVAQDTPSIERSDNSIAEKPVLSSTAIEAGMIKPAANANGVNQASMQTEQAMARTQEPPMHVPPPEMEQVNKIKEPGQAKTILTLIIIAAVILILGGGGWLIYNSFIKKNSSMNDSFGGVKVDTNPISEFGSETKSEDTNNVVIGDVILDNNMESGTSDNSEAPNAIDDAVLFGEPIDSDSDNLDNARENAIGTDPNNWDSDGDGLSDGDEVIIWKTDPLNQDSDGDTYLDGDEVKNGYNPAGPGKIFEPPSGM